MHSRGGGFGSIRVSQMLTGPHVPPFGGRTSGSVPYLGDQPLSIREMLDDGPDPAWVPHMMLRGTYLPNTVRCTSGDPFRVSSYLRDEFGDTSNDLSIKCYIDVQANAYVLGSGPATLTILLFTWIYGTEEAEQDVIEDLKQQFETGISDYFPGREHVMFLGPPVDLSTEVWRFMGNWDVQRREDGTVIAVHPDSHLWLSIKTEEYKTHISKLEMKLPALIQAVTSAHQARVTEYEGRIGEDEESARPRDQCERAARILHRRRRLRHRRPHARAAPAGDVRNRRPQPRRQPRPRARLQSPPRRQGHPPRHRHPRLERRHPHRANGRASPSKALPAGWST